MPTNYTIRGAEKAKVEKLLENEMLKKVFNLLGYPKFGTHNPQIAPSARTSSNQHKALHNILVHHSIWNEQDAHIGANLSPLMSCKPYVGDVENTRALVDIIVGCRFIVLNHCAKNTKGHEEVTWHDIVGSSVRDGVHYESTTSSIRTRDLPDFPNSGALLDWFVWKDSARASLKTMGLNKVVEDQGYAIAHPRQNAAVDGLIIQAIMKDSSNTNLAVTTDNDIDGDGNARWNKLLQLNENPSLIRIILKDLTGEMDKLYLNSLSQFDIFSGTFMETKGRLEYMVAKGEDSNIDNISDHQVKDWKIKYLDKIHVDELSAIKLQCKKDKTLDLWQTFLEIKAWIIDNVHVDRPKKRSAGQKKQHPERKPSNKDKANKAPNTNEGGGNNYHKNMVSSIYNCIKDSTDMDDDQKEMMRSILRTAKSHASGGKPNKKQKRRMVTKKKKAGGPVKKKQKVTFSTAYDHYEGSDYDEIPMEYTDYESE